jgi:hypothetical protein
MRKSRYDELFDKYHKILTTKSGTRYELLTALVFKKLTGSGKVIHDLKLAGEDTEVKHQIDVVVDLDGKKRRVIIECKDFDISDEPVGLGRIRDFYGVVDDIKPDEAIFITCNRFTNEAKQYAKGKGIKLGILRIFENDDWEGRIKSVNIDVVLYLVAPESIRAGLYVDEQSMNKIKYDLSIVGFTGESTREIPIYIIEEDKKIHFNTYVSNIINQRSFEDGHFTKEFLLENTKIEVANLGSIELPGLKLDYDVIKYIEKVDVTFDLTAELIIKTIGSDRDQIITNEDLEKYKIEDFFRIKNDDKVL